MDDINVVDRFEQLHMRRQGILDRKRECSKLTLPHVLPFEGHHEDDELPQPYQSEAANGVNNLASKILLTVLPPQSTPMAIEVAEEVLKEFEAQDPKVRSKVEQDMLAYERAVMEDVNTNAMRPKAFNLIRNLIITGDGCFFVPDEGSPKSFRGDSYVVTRDDSGQVLELIIKETFDRSVLSEDQLEAYDSSQHHKAESSKRNEDDVDVYTYVIYDDKKVNASQYVGPNKVDGTEVSYPKDESPWIVPRWNEVDGENYGRGHVEENWGDINGLETLSKSIILSTGIAAKTVFLVNPNGSTNLKHLSKAPLGSFVAGHPDDVVALQVDKQADLNTAAQLANELKMQLRHVFLRNSSVQRNAERVTAEEIRLMAEELETALGGMYSRLSEEFQRPFLMRIIGRLKKQGKLPKFPKDVVKIRITTGLEAIGRGQNLGKLERALSSLQATPEALSMIHVDELVRRVFNSLGVDTSGLVKTSEEIQQEQQAAQQQAMMQSAVDKGVGPAVTGMAQGMNQQQQG